jgi:hypothetical protein
MPFVVRGEGPFADYVRKALEYAQQHGIDVDGVEVDVVPDTSIASTGFASFTEHIDGLKFRIRYDPRYAGDPVLASHEAGHVAKWTWDYKKRGGVQYVPDIDELLAEAFGSVVARQLYGWPVTFKGAPLNLTQVLPKQTTYITATVDGKPVTVKIPEWGDYMSRYRAAILASPYFYNVTNWSYVLGNFTAAPENAIETVYNAWRSGAVETVPGWGAVWRRTPTWTWSPTYDGQTSGNSQTTTTTNTRQTMQTPTTGGDVIKTASGDTQKTDASVTSTTAVNMTGSTPPSGVIVPTQPVADVPLPPSNVQPPRFFGSDIAPSGAAPEWDSYINGRRVLVVFRNWPFLDTATLKDTRKDYVAGVGVVSDGRLRFEDKVPIPRVIDPDAWIEIVDEKTGKVLARLRSDELYSLTNEGTPVTLYWSHVAVEEKWPGWEKFIDRARELDEKLGTWRSSGVVAQPSGAPQSGGTKVNPDGTASAVKVANAPTEYVSPKVPDDVRRQFEGLLSDLEKLGEGVNLKNIDDARERFIQLRDQLLGIVHAYPQLVDEANNVAGSVGSTIREASDKLYEALAKAAGRDSFWKGEGDVKTPIGVYKYDPATGAFLLSVYDGPMTENIVGYIKDDGTPVVVKKTANMPEALVEYNNLAQKQQATGGSTAQFQPPATQPRQQTGFLQPLRGAAGFLSNAGQTVESAAMAFIQTVGDAARDAVGFLTNALKTGFSSSLTILGGGKPSTPSSDSQGSGFVQAPSSQQSQNEFVAVTPSRAPDYVLAEEDARRNSETTAVSSSGYRPADYVVQTPSGSSSSFIAQSSSGRDYTKGRGLWGASSSSVSSSTAQLVEATQTQSSSESKKRKGRPVAVAT